MLAIRRVAGAAFALLVLGAVVPTIASAHVVVGKATTFTTSNASLISGWYWLRTANASATWRFDATGVKNARVGTVYLQFAPLVTNHVNGGSGYDRTIKVIVTGRSYVPAVTRQTTKSVNLYNPFRPKVDVDTGGLGYQTYGYSGLSTSTWRPSPAPPKVATKYSPKFIDVKVQWTKGYHVAVNLDAVQLAYYTP